MIDNFLESWTSASYFSNSTGSSITKEHEASVDISSSMESSKPMDSSIRSLSMLVIANQTK